MMYRTHILFGFLLGLFALDFFKINNKLLFLLFVILGSIFVDIDSSESLLGSRIKPISWLINKVFGHRGLFHTIYMPLIIFLISIYYGYTNIGAGFSLGYLSHILIDCFNINGIRLFRPISDFHVRGFIRTGGFLESIIFLILLVISLWKLAVIFKIF